MRLLLAFLLLNASLYPEFTSAIVNGQIKNEFDRPEIIRLILVPEDKIFSKDLMNQYSRCTGVAISDSTVLTAGHCVLDEGINYIPHLVRSVAFNQFEVIGSIDAITEYIPENSIPFPETGPVPGCSPGVKPLYETKTIDLALLKFKEKTFSHFLPLDLTYMYLPNGLVELYGFGTKNSSFDNPLTLSLIRTNDLSFTQATVMRKGVNRLATISDVTNGFADSGDSGGPVIVNNKVVGILNTVEEKCETELGEDYAILNSFTLLSGPRTQQWIQNNLKN